jgi:transposase
MPGAYQAARAHEQAKHLAARPKGLKIEDPQLRSFVVAELNEHWPPCQIAAAWMHEPDNGGMTISAETIYQALYVHGHASLRHELKVEKTLRSGHTSRKPRSKLTVARSSGKSWVEGARITDRPEEAEGHLVPGH